MAAITWRGRSAAPLLTFRFPPPPTVTTGDDHVVQLWNVSDGRRLGPPLRMPDIIWTARFSPDGRTLLIGCRDGGAHLFRITPRVEGSPQQVRRWVEVVTGRELGERGDVRFLYPDTWAERKQDLVRIGGPPAE